MAIVILTSGTSWSRPIGCPNVLDSVECWGAGGAGYYSSSGSGAGAGAYSKKNNYNIGLRTTFSIQIPVNTPRGSNAVDTWFDNTSTGVLAKSGTSAGSSSTGVGGKASNCVGEVVFDGGNGGSGSAFFNTSGGGAGAASGLSSGQNGHSSGFLFNGDGGNAGTNGGLGGSSGNNGGSNVNGGGGGGGNCGNGGNPGGGGGGGNSKSTGNIGGRGQITITYTPLTNMVLSIISSRCQL